MDGRKQLEVALRQWLQSHHGVIGRSEAMRLGATAKVIRTKLDRGEWARIHPGVYRDTAVPRSHYQDLRAACVSTGGRAMASHASAAWLWDLCPRPPGRPELTVARAFKHGQTVRGITIHRSTDLDWTRIRTRHAIAVTDPLRTLVDLGATMPAQELAAAVDTGLASRLVSIDALVAELGRLGRHGRPGVPALRRLLAEQGFIGVPEASVLERKMLALLARTGLPAPMVELRVGEDGEYRLDFSYPAIKLAIEVDGYVWHFSPAHLRRDHARRNQLQGSGWLVLIYTWRDIVDEPARVAAEIAENYQRLGGVPARPR